MGMTERRRAMDSFCKLFRASLQEFFRCSIALAGKVKMTGKNFNANAIPKVSVNSNLVFAVYGGNSSASYSDRKFVDCDYACRCGDRYRFDFHRVIVTQG